MAILTTFCNFSFFLLNQNNKKCHSEFSGSPRSEARGLHSSPKSQSEEEKYSEYGTSSCSSSDGETSDLDYEPSFEESGYETSSGSSSDVETSDLDYEPSFEKSGYETSSFSSSEGDLEEASSKSGDASEGEPDPEYKQSTEYSSICDSLTSSLCCPCFKKISHRDPSGSYLEESQLSDLYSNSSFYSIDSEDEEKIKKIKLKMRSLKLEIKNIKLSTLNKSNLSMLKSNSSTLLNN